MQKCSVCQLDAEVAYSIRHTKCGHSTHTDCLEQSATPKNYKECPPCLSGEKPALIEPHTTDGIDYVFNPGNKPVASSWRLFNRTAPPKTTLAHLAEHVPIERLMRVHGVGLDHLLRDGVNLGEDFLANRYTFTDLMHFKDIRNGGKRSQQALMSMGVCANDFKQYPEAFPFKEVAAHIGLKGEQACDFLGLHFPDPESPLTCQEDDSVYNARDCVQFGIKYIDLVACGLKNIHQYRALMRGLSPAEAEAAESALDVTATDISKLMQVASYSSSEEEEEEEKKELPLPTYQRKKKLPPRRKRFDAVDLYGFKAK